MDIPSIQLIVSIVGLFATGGFILFMVRQQNALVGKFSPIIQNVMSSLGKKGSDSKEIQKFEKGMMEDIIDKGLPELGLLQELGILSEDRMEWIKSNPQGMMVLMERWLPLAMKLLNMRGGSGFNKAEKRYDF